MHDTYIKLKKKQYLHMSEIVLSTNNKGLPLLLRLNIAGSKNKNSDLHVNCRIFLSGFNHILFPREFLIEVPNIKFYEIPPSDIRTGKCGKIDGRTQQR
jgi:hypothetical protein